VVAVAAAAAVEEGSPSRSAAGYRPTAPFHHDYDRHHHHYDYSQKTPDTRTSYFLPPTRLDIR
tara:strand:- start:62 stop:250 length:189 start_codon:yes stop_codon:yes gene_type:complete